MLKACTACGAAEYCNKDCQVKHWKAGHKKECKRIRREREEQRKKARQDAEKFSLEDFRKYCEASYPDSPLELQEALFELIVEAWKIRKRDSVLLVSEDYRQLSSYSFCAGRSGHGAWV